MGPWEEIDQNELRKELRQLRLDGYVEIFLACDLGAYSRLRLASFASRTLYGTYRASIAVVSMPTMKTSAKRHDLTIIWASGLGTEIVSAIGSPDERDWQ